VVGKLIKGNVAIEVIHDEEDCALKHGGQTP
jgi:hypothetical protein